MSAIGSGPARNLPACPAIGNRAVEAILAAYERYRALFDSDDEFRAANAIRDRSGCVLRYERTFMRPIFDGRLP